MFSPTCSPPPCSPSLSSPQVPSPSFHEDACHACSLSTPPLFPCSSCSLVFHPACLVPPLETSTPPIPDWRCHHCQPSTDPAPKNDAALSLSSGVASGPSSSTGAGGKKGVKRKKDKRKLSTGKKNAASEEPTKDAPGEGVQIITCRQPGSFGTDGMNRDSGLEPGEIFLSLSMVEPRVPIHPVSPDSPCQSRFILSVPIHPVSPDSPHQSRSTPSVPIRPVSPD